MILFWNRFSDLVALDIKEEKSKKYLKKYNLLKPKLKITFQFGKSKKIILHTSSYDENMVYISASNRKYIFEISKDHIKDLILSEETIQKKEEIIQKKEKVKVKEN